MDFYRSVFLRYRLGTILSVSGSDDTLLPDEDDAACDPSAEIEDVVMLFGTSLTKDAAGQIDIRVCNLIIMLTLCMVIVP